MRYLKLAILILANALIPPAFAQTICAPFNCGQVRQLGPSCAFLNPTPASREAATDRCVNELSANATLFGCLFEDDAGRAEDKRTGLNCAARQAALANQCRDRCVAFASDSSNCRYPDDVWNQVFGDIAGDAVGSARVELCGPPLRHGFIVRPGTVFQRRHN
jgi:hypothetical protein